MSPDPSLTVAAIGGPSARPQSHGREPGRETSDKLPGRPARPPQVARLAAFDRSRARARTVVLAVLVAVLLEFGPVATTATAETVGALPQNPAPGQTTAPSQPDYSSPTVSPGAADASPTATAAPTSSAASYPSPDPEGDRWIRLAIVVGGGLLGTVVFFLIIGSLLRLKYRRQARRNQA